MGLREHLNITGYSHFCPRDAADAAADIDIDIDIDAADPDSDPSSLYCGFGLLHTDYTPKPAFAVYRAACRV